jgi:hypothetical protein
MRKRYDRLIEKWRSFRKRPADERALILRAMIFLPITEIGLRVLGFRRCKEKIENLLVSDPRSQSAIPFETAAKITRAVRSVELHGFGTPNCLERSMVLWWLLRRAGIAGELHIGGRKSGPRFEAHAWVELEGKVLNDSADVHIHYARFDAPIAASETNSGAAAGSVNSRAAGEADLRAASKADLN